MQLGTSKVDITTFVEGVGMLGYGVYYNVVQGIKTPLYARTFFLKNKNIQLIYVNCELCFISPSIKEGVIKKLQKDYPELNIKNECVMISAQHTHSAPGGYSFHPLYNISTPGFVDEIYQNLVIKISESIFLASQNFEDVFPSFASSKMHPSWEVGFQRSLKAYLKNPEAKVYSKKQLHLAIDREMKLLSFNNAQNKPIASINWFATHATSMPNTNTLIHSDNKGYAATFLEEYFDKNNIPHISAFAQGNSGDVSPRFKKNKKHKVQRGIWDGKYSNDDESAKYNGFLQYSKAKEILNSSKKLLADSTLDYVFSYVDFSNIKANPKFANGNTNAYTGPSCIGLAFLRGTEIDGPGMSSALTLLGIVMANSVKFYEYFISLFKYKEYRKALDKKYTSQGNKHIMINTSERKILGTYNIKRLIIPSFVDEIIRSYKTYHSKGALNDSAWTPQVLPLQIFKIGEIAICAFPFEITTIAAQRLTKTIEDVLLPNGFKKIILSPFSNAYSGYITTYEEYQIQEYEGGHTLFGKWSLAALQSEFEKLAHLLILKKEERVQEEEATPQSFSKASLEKLKHYQGRYYKRWKQKKNRIKKHNNIHLSSFFKLFNKATF